MARVPLRILSAIFIGTAAVSLRSPGSWPSRSACTSSAKDWKPTGDLRFIHIPRTMGTAIEQCETEFPPELNITIWSNKPKLVSEVKKTKAFPKLYLKENKNVPGSRWKKAGAKCYVQHIPPQTVLDTFSNHTYYKSGGSNFCVVRNPYERLVSHFGFVMGIAKALWGKNLTCSVEDLNKYMLIRLRKLQQGDIELEDCHFVPQAYYVYGYDMQAGRTDRSKKWCDHVLHYENAGPEFDDLMKRYGYGLRLNWQRNDGKKRGRAMGSGGDCIKLGAKDLSPEVLKLAGQYYAEDFELFNYTML